MTLPSNEFSAIIQLQYVTLQHRGLCSYVPSFILSMVAYQGPLEILHHDLKKYLRFEEYVFCGEFEQRRVKMSNSKY